MIVGFTGTRKGMNTRQGDQLALMLACFLAPPLVQDALRELRRRYYALPGRDRDTAPNVNALVADMINEQPTRANHFHFGGAKGADREARKLAKATGFEIDWHPCPGVSVSELVADGYAPQEELLAERWHEVFPPLVRNHHIVDAVDVLLAAPHTDREELRSGTWATIRYARLKGIPVAHLTRGA